MLIQQWKQKACRMVGDATCSGVVSLAVGRSIAAWSTTGSSCSFHFFGSTWFNAIIYTILYVVQQCLWGQAAVQSTELGLQLSLRPGTSPSAVVAWDDFKKNLCQSSQSSQMISYHGQGTASFINVPNRATTWKCFNVVWRGCWSFCLGVYSKARCVNYTSMDVYREMVLTVTASRSIKCAQNPSILVANGSVIPNGGILNCLCGDIMTSLTSIDILYLSIQPCPCICISGMNRSIYFNHATERQRHRERERETPKLWPSMAYQTVGVPLIFLALQRQALRSSRELNNVHRISSEEHLMKIL